MESQQLIGCLHKCLSKCDKMSCKLGHRLSLSQGYGLAFCSLNATLSKFLSSSHPCKTQPTVKQIGRQVVDRYVGSKYIQNPTSFAILKMLFGCHVLESTFSEKPFLGELLNFWIIASAARYIDLTLYLSNLHYQEQFIDPEKLILILYWGILWVILQTLVGCGINQSLMAEYWKPGTTSFCSQEIASVECFCKIWQMKYKI